MVPRYSGIDKNRSCKKLFNIVLWNLFVIFKCTLLIINLYFLRYLGYVWFKENTKEKKCKGKWFFHVWLSYEKYKWKSNIIKTN